ncbi:kinesin-like protein KIFC1 [Patella vulgata]|uniref:kinesin-like protein KIFC1 n=1 Tax=Patella vulgata TaxID=6465 RepID=UPI0024A9C4E2|nr:kinesin-like protein KIFC1 [Patella vulgata]
MEDDRKPLATSNRIGGLSKLPMPGSRLKPPSSTTKRARSPEIEEAVEINSGKKRCLEKPAPALTLPKTNTTKSLAKTSAKSSANLRSTSNTTRRPLASTKPNNKSVSTLNRSTRPLTNTRPPAVGSVVKKPVSSGISKSKPQSAAAPAPARLSGGSKRPGWDLKGRLQDMEALVLSRENMSAELQSQLESYNKRIFSLESHNQQLTGTVREKELQTQDNTAEISNLRRQIREAEDSLDSTKRRFQREIEDLTFSKSTLERQKETLSGELSANQAEITGLKSSIAELTSTQAKSAAELEGMRINLTDANSTIKIRDETIVELKDLVRQHEEKIKEQELKLIEQETTRRQLHNTIQELKGNIRVFCRVRPLLGKETIGNDGIITHMNFPDTDGKILEMDKIGDANLNESTLNSTRGASKYEFNFDKVFDPTSTQASVFEEISQLVQSALDGYIVFN